MLLLLDCSNHDYHTNHVYNNQRKLSNCEISCYDKRVMITYHSLLFTIFFSFKKKAKNNARNRKNSINEHDDRVVDSQLNENLEDLNEKDDDQVSENVSPVNHEGEEVWEVKELFGSDEKISRDDDKDYVSALQQHPTNESCKNDEPTLQQHLTNESDKNNESTLQQPLANDDKDDDSTFQKHLTNEGDKDCESTYQQHLTNEQSKGDSNFEAVKNPFKVSQFDKNSKISVSCIPDASPVNPEYSFQIRNPDESKELVAAFVKEVPVAGMFSFILTDCNSFFSFFFFS